MLYYIVHNKKYSKELTQFKVYNFAISQEKQSRWYDSSSGLKSRYRKRFIFAYLVVKPTQKCKPSNNS